MTDQELKDLVASLAIQSTKTDAKIAEFATQSAKNEAFLTKKFAETDARLEKHAAQSAKNEAFLTKKFAETDARLEKQFAETKTMLDNLEKKIQKLSNMYGGMGNNLGEEAELNFTQIFKKTPKLSNISFDTVEANLHKHKGRKEVEIDIFMLNGNSMAIIEVKRHLQSQHIEHLHEKTIPNFLALYPEYKNKKLYAAFATYGISKRTKPHINDLIKEYGYGIITPDSSGLDIDIDTSCLRVLN